MAVSTQLTKAVAELYGESETLVGNTYRYLRENGLVSKAGRGVTGAHMTAEDCITLLCAVMGSRQINESVAAAKAILGLRTNSRPGYQGRAVGRLPNELLGLDVEHSLGEALVRLMDLFGQPHGSGVSFGTELTDLAERLRVEFVVCYPEYSATIEFRISKIHHTISYGRAVRTRAAAKKRTGLKSTRGEDAVGEIDIRRCRKCSDRTLRRLAKLVAN